MRRGRATGRKPAGKQYEEIVANIHRQFAGVSSVTENDKIRGRSGLVRQIDVSLRTLVVGNSILVIIDAKDYHRKVTVTRVEELIGKMADVGAARGVLVSDSGFTSGAIDRATEHGAIDLVSVIDTNDNRLRSRIGLPVQVTFHDVVPMGGTINIQRHPSHQLMRSGLGDADLRHALDEDTADIKRQFGDELFKKGCNWHAASAGDFAEGEHTFTHVFVDNQDMVVTGTFRIRVSIRCFVNERLFMRGVGIYSHLSKTVTVGQGLNDVHLDADEIKATWREEPPEYVLERCKNFYTVVARINPSGWKLNGVIA